MLLSAKEGKIEFTYVVTGPFLDTFLFRRGAIGYDPASATFTAVGPEDLSQQATISGTTYKDTGLCVSLGPILPRSTCLTCLLCRRLE